MSLSLDAGYHDAIRVFRRDLLRHALTVSAGNRTHAARLLGVQRTYFMRLIRDLGADDIRPAA
jgi:DNA-binding NtrC family response regulator